VVSEKESQEPGESWHGLKKGRDFHLFQKLFIDSKAVYKLGNIKTEN
jgi:hypothetical protein